MSSDIITASFEAFASHPVVKTIVGAAILGAAAYTWWEKRKTQKFRYSPRRQKVRNIQEYLGDAAVVDPTVSAILLGAFSDHAFADEYGYVLDKGRRDLLVPIISNPECPVSWSLLKDARSYLKITNGELKISIKRSDVLGYRFKTVLAVVLYVAACIVSLVGLAAIERHRPQPQVWLQQLVVVLLPASSMILISVGLMLSTFGLDAARRLDAFIKKSQSPSPETS
jgi:cytochrome bd-type quinol oxidase subunit 1